MSDIQNIRVCVNVHYPWSMGTQTDRLILNWIEFRC
uniref:Uncharacterized protein n=1 Tax=Anguilla anguilla TaxID=7936 RepID=A0A0E9RRF4_ANGAN